MHSASQVVFLALALTTTAVESSLAQAVELPANATAFSTQPAGPPPTPRHTGIKALAKHLVTNFKYLPAKENLLWAGGGGGLALAAYPFDDDVNRALVGSDTATRIFKPGAIVGSAATLLGSAAVVYSIGRIKDQPKVSHVGMDLIEALAMSGALTQTIKHTTRRERPDGSDEASFPSGHAAGTFAFATALERHLNWRFSVPAYAFSSYVAISRLPANRHWLSDVVFGSAVGIIAGRTVTSHEAERPYPVALTIVPGGAAIVIEPARVPPRRPRSLRHSGGLRSCGSWPALFREKRCVSDPAALAHGVHVGGSTAAAN